MIRVLFLIIFNFLRFNVKKIRCKNLNVSKTQMIGFNSRLVFEKSSAIRIGKKMVTDGRFVIIAGENCTIDVGQSVYFNEGAMISCKGKVRIGDGCKFGPNVKIFDNNHTFDSESGVSDEHVVGSVWIGNKCWIGSNVVILKGAKIGNNCIIGAGCIINSEVEPGSIVKQKQNNLEVIHMRQ